MPIEIKELVIRAVVDRDVVAQPDGVLSEEAADQIVAACVEEVLRVLRRSKER